MYVHTYVPEYDEIEGREKRVMEIRDQLANIEELQNTYEMMLETGDANSREAIQAFLAWHTAAVEFFAEVLGVEEPLLEKFQPNGLDGNGYVLRSVYHSILGTYAMLKVKVRKYMEQNGKRNIAVQAEIDQPKSNIKPKKIFISHSSGDGEFAKALVNLLVLMGFDAKKEIFCSSVPDCWVEDGEDFISVIKKHFDECKLYVIYIHSPRFYERHITLNEMGAAWALQSEYSSFLTKDMSFGEMDAVVPNTKVAIKVDSPEAEARMNSWRKRILAWFGKDEKNDSLWEMHRNSFLKFVRDLSYPKKNVPTKAPIIPQREEIQLSAKDEDILKQWVNSNGNEMYKAEYIGGGCIILGDTDYQYETPREEAEWNDFFKRLLKMGFIESTGRGGDSARYLLTAKAYKYFD